MKLSLILDYASLFPLMALTTDLLFIANYQGGIIYARTEGLVWTSSHYLSLLAVVGTAWFLVLKDRFQNIFWNVLAMFDMGSLHEILFSRLYYINSLSVFIGTWLTFGISMVGLVITFVWGRRWMKVACIVAAVFLPVYFYAVGQYYLPTVQLGGGFLPGSDQPWPNLLDISSWAIPSFVFAIVRVWRSKPSS